MGRRDRPDGHHRDPVHLRSVYDTIASHFSKTRAHPWPEVEAFLAAVDTDATGSLGLDVGCGNGRHTELLAETVETAVGVDASRGLLEETRAKMAEDGWSGRLLQGNAGGLPLEDGVADVAVYVATLHHLPDGETRRESLAELSRVLADDGRGLVSAWSTAHDRFDAGADATTGFETTVDWTLPGGETLPRFYYIYAPAEFERELRASPLTVEKVYVSSGNCYAEVR